MKLDFRLSRYLLIAGAMASAAALPAAAQAAGLAPFTLRAADPSEQGDGTMSPAARRSMLRGALPKDAAEVAAKAAADRAARAASASDVANGPNRGPLAGGTAHNFTGLPGVTGSPPDTQGAIGPTRYIELVNNQYAIYNRSTHAVIATGTLNELAGLAESVNTFDPQILWDHQTNRFYYMNDSVFSAGDNRLSYGFSKTGSPSNGTTDWCQYTFLFGTRFPDYPKMGDSQFFIIAGVNSFTGPIFAGSDLFAISKPPAGTACPDVATFKTGTKLSLTDTGGNDTFTPVPANEIDVHPTGFVVTRNGGLPSNKLTFYSVTRNGTTGNPIFGGPRTRVVTSYALPPGAPAGAGSTRLLDTLDARPTNAVMSINPDRGANAFSFWTQHTIKHATQNRSIVRFYEINPVPLTPTLLRQGEVGNLANADTFYFNAAISSDRRVAGATKLFGDSFVMNYSVSRSAAPAINPRIEVTSSFSGGAVGGALVVKTSPAAFVDFSCAGATDTCRWGDYAAANPDPLAGSQPDRGVVWGANQFGDGSASTATANWETQIFAHRP